MRRHYAITSLRRAAFEHAMLGCLILRYAMKMPLRRYTLLHTFATTFDIARRPQRHKAAIAADTPGHTPRHAITALKIHAMRHTPPLAYAQYDECFDTPLRAGQPLKPYTHATR